MTRPPLLFAGAGAAVGLKAAFDLGVPADPGRWTDREPQMETAAPFGEAAVVVELSGVEPLTS